MARVCDAGGAAEGGRRRTTTRQASLRRWAVAIVLASSSAGTAAQPAPDRYDVIMRHGKVVDGTGRHATGLTSRSPRIDRARRRLGGAADVDIDATGLFVAPGFINIHSHAAPEGLSPAENMLTQGVTTEILNADGGGPLDIGGQLDGEAGGLAVNVGANIGFNSAWTAGRRRADRRPTAERVSTDARADRRHLERGAWGVSAGLDYKPAYFATTEEVVEVVGRRAPWRTNFTNHDRADAGIQIQLACRHGRNDGHRRARRTRRR